MSEETAQPEVETVSETAVDAKEEEPVTSPEVIETPIPPKPESSAFSDGSSKGAYGH